MGPAIKDTLMQASKMNVRDVVVQFLMCEGFTSKDALVMRWLGQIEACLSTKLSIHSSTWETHCWKFIPECQLKRAKDTRLNIVMGYVDILERKNHIPHEAQNQIQLQNH